MLAAAALIAAIVIFRLYLYGDPRLSIANNDTSSYVASAKVNLLNQDAFTGRRLFTTNVIYQLLEPDGGYRIIVNGSQQTRPRYLQPSFAAIAVLQAAVSIFAWALLAWVTAAQL